MIIKGDSIAAAPMGDPNASIRTPQPVHYHPMFGAFGRDKLGTSLMFVSDAALAGGLAPKVEKRLVAVEDTRGKSRKKVDGPERLDAEDRNRRCDHGRREREPAERPAMAQLCFLI
jgi:urease alpha subunit